MKAFFGLFLTVAMASAGCTKKSTDYNLDVKETLRVALGAEPPSLDWHKSTDTTSNEVVINLMDGLVDYDMSGEAPKMIPALAAKWESSKDQKKWVFTLRDDVKWTDGTPFTAQHVVDGWERLLNKDTAAPYAYMLFNVKNARKYNQGEITDFAQVGIKVNAKGQLEVELESPQSYFPMLTAHHSLYPVRKDVAEKFGERWTRPENIQTLGAYALKVWDNDKALVLERNDNYYGEKAKTKYVLMRVVKEVSTALKMFEKGQLDTLSEVPSLEMARLKTMPQFKTTPILGIYYLGFNVKKKPLDNPDVRKAINMAIDREEIVKLLDGGQKALYGWLPVGSPGYDADAGLRFNPEEAKKLLDKAGFADRSKFPKLVAGFNTNENHQRVLENVQAQLKRNLGINIELQNTEWKSYNALLQADPPMVFRMGWIADYPDPDTFFALITSDSENNHTNWGNPKFDSLVKRAVSVAGIKEREKLYKEAHKILTEQDVPVIPIYSYVNHAMVADRVQFYPQNVLKRYTYKQVVLK